MNNKKETIEILVGDKNIQINWNSIVCGYTIKYKTINICNGKYKIINFIKYMEVYELYVRETSEVWYNILWLVKTICKVTVVITPTGRFCIINNLVVVCKLNVL